MHPRRAPFESILFYYCWNWSTRTSAIHLDNTIACLAHVQLVQYISSVSNPLMFCSMSAIVPRYTSILASGCKKWLFQVHTSDCPDNKRNQRTRKGRGFYWQFDIFSLSPSERRSSMHAMLSLLLSQNLISCYRVIYTA